jgi:hypothetical protein
VINDSSFYKVSPEILDFGIKPVNDFQLEAISTPSRFSIVDIAFNILPTPFLYPAYQLTRMRGMTHSTQQTKNQIEVFS